LRPLLAQPGYIAFKAAAAALLALAAVELAQLPDALSATFVAVVCISPVTFSGLRRGLEQLGGSALGGGTTFLLALWLPKEAALFAALWLTVWLCFAVGLSRAYAVAGFTVLYVLLLPGDSPSLTLEYRMASVALGVLAATSLNLAVSLVRFRPMLRRRLGVVRRLVADEWLRLSRALAAGPEGAGAGERAGLFEEAFGVLRTLGEELADAHRESALMARRTREEVAALAAGAEQLVWVAHHGKDLLAEVERAGGAYPKAAAAAAQLAHAIDQQTAAALPEEVEPPLGRALQLAARAWAQAHGDLIRAA
jgi:hypothetical protein